MFVFVLAFAVCFATREHLAVENKRLKHANQALLEALRTLNEVEASVSSTGGCEDKTNKWGSCTDGTIDLLEHCSDGVYQRYCAKSCCETNEACAFHSCGQCVAASGDSGRTCDWVIGACTQVSPNVDLKVRSMSDCPASAGEASVAGNCFDDCLSMGIEDSTCHSWC